MNDMPPVEGYISLNLLYTALIWSAKDFDLQPCWKICVLLIIRAF